MIGIDALGYAFPRHYLPLSALARARGAAPEKFERGLGCVRMAVPHPAEDTVTLAAAAAREALATGKVSPADIGLLIVGTETAVDHAKPVASYVQGLLNLPADCRVFEIKHACYGGTAGILTACEWIASGANRGRKALVIAADIARYPLGSPGEPTQGAGAAALVIAADPRIAEVDFLHTGRHSRDVHDFWRPLSESDARVDGAFSLACYMEGVRESYARYLATGGEAEAACDALLFHMPFARMAEKAHAELLAAARGPLEAESISQDFERRVAPGTAIARAVGNTYSASLWCGLAGLLHAGDLPRDTRVGCYSYGSGFCAEFFTLRMLTPEIMLPSVDALAVRQEIDVATYEAWRGLRMQNDGWDLPSDLPFAFVGRVDEVRRYRAAEPLSS